MNISEFIGFIITMVFLIFLFLKRTWEDIQRQKHPEKYAEKERKQEEAVRELLKSMNLPVEEVEEEAEPEMIIEPPKPVPTRPHRAVSDNFEFHTKLEDRHPESAVEQREFKTRIEDRYATPYARRVASADMRTALPDDPYAFRQAARSRAQELMSDQSSLRNVILLQSIIGPPKALSDVPSDPFAHQ